MKSRRHSWPGLSLIHILIVRADLREIGIGSSLLDAAKDWARSRGLEHLELNTLPENRDAARLYERNGFEPSLIRMQYRF